jgi:hypothetical protein
MLLLLACGDDSCVLLPCPEVEAVQITVATSQGTNPPPGLTANLSSGPAAGISCNVSVCHVFGGPGDYVIRVSATGFTSQDVKVKVTGEAAGCSTCGRVDTQHVSIVLAPTAGD